jgi:hypothetical protein
VVVVVVVVVVMVMVVVIIFIRGMPITFLGCVMVHLFCFHE